MHLADTGKHRIGEELDATWRLLGFLHAEQPSCAPAIPDGARCMAR